MHLSTSKTQVIFAFLKLCRTNAGHQVYVIHYDDGPHSTVGCGMRTTLIVEYYPSHTIRPRWVISMSSADRH